MLPSPNDIYLKEGENRLDVAMSPVAAPPIDYSGKKAWCAYRIYHEFPGKNVTTWVVTHVEGKIGNLSVELTKAGLAGVEVTSDIRTGEETKYEKIALEVLGWWEYGKYRTGVTIYDYNYWPNPKTTTKMVDAAPGEMLRYDVSIYPIGVNTRIWNASGTLIFEYLYECDAKRFLELHTELEYWRYYDIVGGEIIIRKGKFNFAGEVTLDRAYREGVGWVNPADVCSYYLDIVSVEGICDPKDLLSYDHYKEGGSWVFKGRVKDIV